MPKVLKCAAALLVGLLGIACGEPALGPQFAVIPAPRYGALTGAALGNLSSEGAFDVLQVGLFQGDSRAGTREVCDALDFQRSRLVYVVHLLAKSDLEAPEMLTVTVDTPASAPIEHEVEHSNGVAILGLVAPPGAGCSLSITGTMAGSTLRCLYGMTIPEECALDSGGPAVQPDMGFDGRMDQSSNSST